MIYSQLPIVYDDHWLDNPKIIILVKTKGPKVTVKTG